MTRGMAKLEAEIGDAPQRQFGKRTVNANYPVPEVSAVVEQTEELKNAFRINVSQLIPDPNNPRTNFEDEAMEELTSSIRDIGVQTPLVVRPHETPGRWYIVEGERRWRATTTIGRTHVPCVVTDQNAEDILLVQLHLNCIRSDLHAIELGRSYARLAKERKWSEYEAADKLKKSQSYVSKLMTISELPQDVQDEAIANRWTFTKTYTVASKYKRSSQTSNSQRQPTRRQSAFEYHCKFGRGVVTIKAPNATEADAEKIILEMLEECRSRQAKSEAA